MLYPAAPKILGLTVHRAPPAMLVIGVGGVAETGLTYVSRLALGNLNLRDVRFVVGGAAYEPGVAGLLGQDVLGLADVDYDLAGGAIRLLRAPGCGARDFPDWGKTRSAWAMALDPINAAAPHAVGRAFINGVRMKAAFDTGAATTILTRAAARRAGIDVRGFGAAPAHPAAGIGARLAPTWIAPITTFTIGGETMHDLRLRIVDTALGEVDMLIGADFFLTHRVYVAADRGRLFAMRNPDPSDAPGTPSERP